MDISRIEKEIMKGPVLAVVKYDTKFSLYTGSNGPPNIYRPRDASRLHLVLLLGWGENSNGKYWVFMNAYGEWFGKNNLGYWAKNGLEVNGKLWVYTADPFWAVPGEPILDG